MKHRGFRAVHADFTSTNGYRWPYPGKIARPPEHPTRAFTSGDPCPQYVGDGLCVAKTFRGMGSGGIPAITVLIVDWDSKDVLGEDGDKVRVSKCKVIEVLDWPLLARNKFVVSSEDAPMDLRFANLRSANLRSADLGSADLGSADLGSANLGFADLRFANLRSADLGSADLRFADLRFANLRSANLGFADLGFADLGSADLGSANANVHTVWPDGFDARAAGVNL